MVIIGSIPFISASRTALIYKFRGGLCFYQWVEKRGKRINYSKAYKHWLLGRRTLAEIYNNLDVSYPKLNKEFDRFDISEDLLKILYMISIK
jgi:hypothetical protein